MKINLLYRHKGNEILALFDNGSILVKEIRAGICAETLSDDDLDFISEGLKLEAMNFIFKNTEISFDRCVATCNFEKDSKYKWEIKL